MAKSPPVALADADEQRSYLDTFAGNDRVASKDKPHKMIRRLSEENIVTDTRHPILTQSSPNDVRGKTS